MCPRWRNCYLSPPPPPVDLHVSPAELLHGPAGVPDLCHVPDFVTGEIHDIDIIRRRVFAGRRAGAALAGMRSKTGGQDLKAEGNDLWLRNVPGVVVDAVAGCVARLLVLHPAVERLTFVGPLLRAIVAGDNRPTSRGLARAVSLQRRPVFRAFAVAIRLAGRVFVKGVEGHAA